MLNALKLLLYIFFSSISSRSSHQMRSDVFRNGNKQTVFHWPCVCVCSFASPLCVIHNIEKIPYYFFFATFTFLIDGRSTCDRECASARARRGKFISTLDWQCEKWENNSCKLSRTNSRRTCVCVCCALDETTNARDVKDPARARHRKIENIRSVRTHKIPMKSLYTKKICFIYVIHCAAGHLQVIIISQTLSVPKVKHKEIKNYMQTEGNKIYGNKHPSHASLDKTINLFICFGAQIIIPKLCWDFFLLQNPFHWRQTQSK